MKNPKTKEYWMKAYCDLDGRIEHFYWRLQDAINTEKDKKIKEAFEKMLICADTIFNS